MPAGKASKAGSEGGRGEGSKEREGTEDEGRKKGGESGEEKGGKRVALTEKRSTTGLPQRSRTLTRSTSRNSSASTAASTSGSRSISGSRSGSFSGSRSDSLSASRSRSVPSSPGTNNNVSDKIERRRLYLNDFASEDELESDEEEEANRIGAVPLWYYDESEHVGYNLQGERIAQTMSIKDSAINNLLERATNPDYWRTVTDVKNQTKSVLSAADLEILQRIKEGRLGLQAKTDEELAEECVEFEWDDHQPLTHRQLKKKSFTPSKTEEKKINRLVSLIRAGLLYRKDHDPEGRRKEKERERLERLDLWGENIFNVVANDEDRRRKNERLPALTAPKLPPPSTAESYNPPDEYLFTEEEREKWLNAHPDDRLHDFLPGKFKSLRLVPGYAALLSERFQRCLDLYLCPRTMRHQWIENSSELLPELPPLESFKPFPELQAALFRQEGSEVVSLAFSSRELLAVGMRDGSLSILHTATPPYQLPLSYFRTRTSGIHYAIRNLHWHLNLPILTFSRARYLFVCLVQHPDIAFEDLRRLVDDQNVDQKVDNSEQNTQNRKYGKYRDALALMSCDGVPAVSLKNAPKSVGGKASWRSFQSRPFYGGGLRSRSETNDALLKDEDGSVSTDLSEDEDTSHATLTAKDWAETVKFVDLLASSRQIVQGFVIALGGPSTSIDFHKKGGYIVTASPSCSSPSHQCLLHSMRKKTSLAPLKRSTRSEQLHEIRFHPKKPWLCVGFGHSTRVFSMLKASSPSPSSSPSANDEGEEGRRAKGGEGKGESKDSVGIMVKKFRGADQSVQLAMHPSGEHLMRASVDGKLQWFDFEHGQLPYKVMEVVPDGAVTSMAHHPTRKLLAMGFSVGDVRILHTDAEEDSLNPVQITPLTKLSDTKSHITALAWHPLHHWLVTGHQNGRLALWI